MKNVALFLIWFILLASRGRAEVFLREEFLFGGTNDISSITDSDLKGVPVWRESEENPPFSPRAALYAAKTCLTNLFGPVSTIMDSIVLKEVGRDTHWVY